jgi:Holliday junction resolvase RusA-like endonuclease
MYDPSADKKKRYGVVVKQAMLQYGLTIPYFSRDEPITVRVRYVLPRCRQDLVRQGDSTVLTQSAQAFPRNKDVDNMIKVVMDALQGIMYHNDVIITQELGTNMFPENANVRGWTEVELSTTTQAPPLAADI